MAKGSWVDTWKGGRVSRGPDGERVYWLEKMASGQRYSFRLGALSEPDAEDELRDFRRNPSAYRPPEVRAEQERLDVAEAERVEAAGAVYLTADLIERAAKAYLNGYPGRKGVSKKQAEDWHRYVSEWAVSPALKGRDLRKVTAAEMAAQLATWTSATRNRINNWNALVRWLRKGAKLITPQVFQELHLDSIQPRKPTKKELLERVCAPGDIEAIYRHIPSAPRRRPKERAAPQLVRDVLRVRAMTGMHVTEIERIAQGKGVLERNPRRGAIAGKVTFPHKSGHEHTQSLDPKTFASLERIVKSGRVPSYDQLGREIEWAAAASGREPFDVADLRATFVTLARTKGELKHVPGSSGIPLALVAQIVGHTDPKTTATFYDATEWPPLISIPLQLVHSDDPK